MKLRIGTRGSALALAQADQVARRLADLGNETELVTITTAGDRGATPSSSPAGLKGLFVTEISRALLAGEVDLAIHSAKDLPAEEEDGLVIAVVPRRESPLDVLITREGELRPGSVVGTASLRRRAQLLWSRPDVQVRELRGNVDTRLRKLAEGEFDATVLAAAGLLRLGVVPEHAAPLPVAEMVPAPGQGCLAVETRTDDAATLEALAPLDHIPSRIALEAERGLMLRLGGGCALPLGALATANDDGSVSMVSLVADPDGLRIVRSEVSAAGPAEAAEAAEADLLSRGAGLILEALR